MVEGQVIPTISHHHQPAQGRSRITVSAEQSSGFSEICVKCPIEYRTTKSTTQKNYDKLLNFWVDVMTTHDLMRTETTQMSKKNLDNRR